MLEWLTIPVMIAAAAGFVVPKVAKHGLKAALKGVVHSWSWAKDEVAKGKAAVEKAVDDATK